MFTPKRIIFEKDVMKYEMAKRIYEKFHENPEIEIIQLQTKQFTKHIPGDDLYTMYREGKKTLVVDTKQSLKFQSCKPSAHYQLPLITGCMGQCEYCYLNTNLGDKPFLRVHANLEQILEKADQYTTERLPELTIFEGAATSDPVPVEPYTHSLEESILHFAATKDARFRFVTKYNDVDTLLSLEHKGHTEVRFSINTDFVIRTYEHGTASRDKRIEASVKMAAAGYPIGFLIAPVFIYETWKEDYHDLMVQLKNKLPQNLEHPVLFEVISHRYTTIAKNRILEIFPETKLPMKEEERRFQYGQFGYGKYLYPKDVMQEIKEFFTNEINEIFDNKQLKYVI